MANIFNPFLAAEDMGSDTEKQPRHPNEVHDNYDLDPIEIHEPVPATWTSGSLLRAVSLGRDLQNIPTCKTSAEAGRLETWNAENETLRLLGIRPEEVQNHLASDEDSESVFNGSDGTDSASNGSEDTYSFCEESNNEYENHHTSSHNQTTSQTPRDLPLIMSDIIDTFHQDSHLRCETCTQYLIVGSTRLGGVRHTFWKCARCNPLAPNTALPPTYPRAGFGYLAPNRNGPLSRPAGPPSPPEPTFRERAWSDLEPAWLKHDDEEDIERGRRNPKEVSYFCDLENNEELYQPAETNAPLPLSSVSHARDLQTIPSREVFEEAGGVDTWGDDDGSISPSTDSGDIQSLLASDEDAESMYDEPNSEDESEDIDSIHDEDEDNGIHDTPSQSRSPHLLPWTTFRTRYLSGANIHSLLNAEGECPVCYRDYSTLPADPPKGPSVIPVRLPCAGRHHICLGCAQRCFVSRQPEGDNMVRNTCPMCREVLYEFESAGWLESDGYDDQMDFDYDEDWEDEEYFSDEEDFDDGHDNSEGILCFEPGFAGLQGALSFLQSMISAMPTIQPIPPMPTPPPLPALPALPQLPAIPAIPAIPEIPAILPIPAVPGIPGVPGLPAIPAIPAISPIPAMYRYERREEEMRYSAN